MIIIGDVHGKTGLYHGIVRDLKEKTIQVGDFGFERPHRWHMANIDPDQHKVLFGNHDYYPLLHERHSLGDFMFQDGIMTIRGAFSIDKDDLTKGFDWFEEEQLDNEKCIEVVDMFSSLKPSIVITHDCPTEVFNYMSGRPDKTQTRQMLQVCFIHHQPDVWVFGHHHRSFETQMNRTRFVCLAELETFHL